MAAAEAGLLFEDAHIWIPHVSDTTGPRMVSVCEKPSMANSLNLQSELQRTGESVSAMRAPVLPRRGLIARRAGGLTTRPPRLAIVAVILARDSPSFDIQHEWSSYTRFTPEEIAFISL